MDCNGTGLVHKSSQDYPFLLKEIQNPPYSEDYGQSLILKTIQEAGRPLNVDKIIELTKLEPQIVNQSLTLLLIQKMIKEMGKGYTL